uniref:Photosystem II Psb31 protein domain-containing protein n=1 Tax=Alexandrium monilatum TaxID=311494 RepID=A0A7S4RVL5_9DINO|mmetsp:Transcript_67378/g.213211  ORF Transcript_67378/g.213211 Transcript_67378/m.213211 type:complete len:171 (+) Transcript_67378:2-514(+)
MARRSSTLAVAALVLGALCLARLASDAFLSGAASRREVLGAAVAGAAALGGLAPARADWQGEPIQALQVLGPEIVGLKDAVNSGDLADVSAKLVKFDLYTSGVLKNKAAQQAKASAIVDKLSDAVQNKNVAGVKAAYAEFMKATSLEEIFSLPKGRSYHIVTPTASMATR